MTKKQVASKSSGKRRNVEPSSSSAPVVEEIQASKKKGFIAERGFVTEKPSEGFATTVTALGWWQFVKHRKDYIGSLVRDFYKGIAESSDGKPSTYSMVRGERVDFDPRTINDYYGLGYFGKAIESKQKSYGQHEMDELKGRICTDDAVWEKSGGSGAEFKLLKKYLCEEANLWFGFVRHSLLPTSHTLYVEKERLLIIDAIMSGDKIEVGKLINREINKFKNRKDGNLYFPCLITDLCIKAEVEIDSGELREEPMGAFPTKFKPRHRAANATTSAESQTLQRLVLHQQGLARFVKEQFEWQKKINAQLTKGKSTIPTPEMPDWLIDDEEEDEEPLSTMQARIVKKEKAKRMRSPAKKKQSPAKKKKKVSSEEEIVKSSELEEMSESDIEETRKVAREIMSEEESEETLSEGKESEEEDEETDIECDAPPTKPTKSPAKQPSPPHESIPTIPDTIVPEITIPTQPPPTKANPPQKDQSTIVSENPPSTQENVPEPIPTPSADESTKGITAEKSPAKDAVASEAAKEAVTQKLPTRKTRVKHAPKQSPFSKKSAATADVEEESQEKLQHVPILYPATDEPAEQMQKLPVKRKIAHTGAGAASATSKVFMPESEKDAAEASAEGGDAAAIEPEVENAPTESVADPGEQVAEKGVAEKIAELQAKRAKDVAAAEKGKEAGADDAIASKEVVADEEKEAEKKKKEKKKKAESTQVPSRASTRLRSGALKQ